MQIDGAYHGDAIKSPCKTCPRWKTDFPKCFQEGCLILEKIQDVSFRIAEDRKKSAENNILNDEEEKNLQDLAKLFRDGKTFCDDCPKKGEISLNYCQNYCEKFRVQKAVGFEDEMDHISASISWIEDIFWQILEDEEDYNF